MKFNQLTVKRNKKPSSVGRGISAGRGKTAGRGTKGQNSRAGGGVRLGFEGGQNPLMRRVPKLRGFHSHRPKTVAVYTADLNSLRAQTVDNSVLAENGLIENPYSSVKLIFNGKIDKKFTVRLQGSSAAAAAALKKSGGSFEKVPAVQRAAKQMKQAKD